MADDLSIECKTKAGVKRMNIGRAATERFGFLYGQRVQTPFGPASVMGVNQDRLYFHVEGDEGASYWSGCNSKEAFDQRGFVVLDEGAPVSVASMADTKERHNLKTVNVFGHDRVIVMQSQNGPCPIIALANALLLRGELDAVAAIAVKSGVVAAEELRAAVLEYLLADRPAPQFSDSARTEGTLASLARDANHIAQLRTQLTVNGRAMLSRFYDGLNVAPTFDVIDGFAAEDDALLFVLARLRMVHGWIMDFADTDEANDLRTKTYEELVCVATDDTSPVCSHACAFLTAHPSQLTDLGVALLLSELDDGEVAVLFHNNHFSTLVKKNDNLMGLVTDVGFTDRRHVVFEGISVSGDNAFYDGDGRPISQIVMQVLESYGNRYSVAALSEAEERLRAAGTEPTMALVVAAVGGTPAGGTPAAAGTPAKPATIESAPMLL